MILKTTSTLLAITLTATLAFAQNDPLKVTGGEIRGALEDGVMAYKGIPFAAPPDRRSPLAATPTRPPLDRHKIRH